MNTVTFRDYLGNGLTQGYDYDEAIPNMDLDKEAEKLTSKLFDLCESGMSKFEAFIKISYSTGKLDVKDDKGL